jgi:hypothetical protein
MRLIAVVAAAGLTAVAPVVSAQENRAPGEPFVYRAEFVIHDGSDAATKTGRRFTMLIDGGGKGVFRSGNKIPYATGAFQPGTGAAVAPVVATQYQYAEIGVNIDCRVREQNGKIALHAALEMSNIVPRDKAPDSLPPNPTISSTRFEVNATLNPGKPELVASIDDPITARKLDVEATVTRLN